MSVFHMYGLHFTTKFRYFYNSQCARGANSARRARSASPVTISACIDGACPALRLEVDGRVAAAADWVRGRLWRRILVHARW